MASSIVLKQLRGSNVLRSGGRLVGSFRPAVATDQFSNTRGYHNESASLTTKETVPRSFKREDAHSVFLFIDMPGIGMKDVDVTVKSYGYFNVKGVVNRDYECESRNYQDSFDLPKNIKKSGIKAAMENGVLKLTLPKIKEIKQEAEEEETSGEFKIMVN